MELFRALAVLAEPPHSETARIVELLALGKTPDPTDYVQLFLFELYPYASVYLGEEGMLGGEARDRFAGFWRALDETPPPEPDHLALVLGLYAHLGELVETEPDPHRRDALRAARGAYLWEHVLSWLPVYLEKLVEIAPPPYDAWGRLLRRALEREAEAAPPLPLPLHLRAAPPPAELNRSSSDAFLAALLTPVRSGIILTRADLARAARELGLGLRAGERLYMLRALIDQDPQATLQWVEREAAGWQRRHRASASTLGIVAAYWARRAATTADHLRRIRSVPHASTSRAL